MLSQFLEHRAEHFAKREVPLNFIELSAYLDSGKTEVTDKARKLENAAVYVNGLLEHGGPSTDVFIKTLGTDKTRLLFEKYLFGIKQ